MGSKWVLIVVAVVALSGQGVWAGDWTNQGGDAGMTKYSPDNIVAGTLEQVYRKRFYSKYSNWQEGGVYSYYNYNVANNVVIRNGVAVAQSYDIGNNDNYNNNIWGLLYTTVFDWKTGQTSARIPMRQTNSNDWDYATNPNMWFHAWMTPAEISDHHFTFPTVFGSDGRIYMRRGGDQRAMGALTLNSNNTTGTWTYLPADLPRPNRGWAGDASASLNIYKDRLLFHPGDTRDGWNYASRDISATAWATGAVANDQGAAVWINNAAPRITGNSFYDGLRAAGDIPKAAQDVVVVAGWYNYGGTSLTYLTASNVYTGQQLWTQNYPSNNVGRTGFYAGTSDYWQFVASEDGYYAMFNRPSGQPATVRVLDLLTGTEKWSKTLSSDASPLLAEHGGFLYVVARNEQMKVHAETGSIVWQTTNSFTGDLAKYVDDPMYRPVVLTDDSLWFVNNFSSGGDHLIGLRTSDGQMFLDLNLQDLMGPNEVEVAVQDLVAADGLLGVFVNVKDLNDPHLNKGVGTGQRYQDLFVFQTLAVPEPGALGLLAVSAAGLLTRRRR